MTEKELYKKLKKWMPKPAVITRMETGGTSSGVPDLFLLYNEKGIWIELKILRSKNIGSLPVLRPGQFSWLYRHCCLPVYILCVHPETQKIYVLHAKSLVDNVFVKDKTGIKAKTQKQMDEDLQWDFTCDFTKADFQELMDKL